MTSRDRMGSYTGFDDNSNHYNSMNQQPSGNAFLGSNSSRKRRDGSEQKFNATFFPSVAQTGN